MSVILLAPTSPVPMWVVSLLRAARIRKQAEAGMAATGKLDVHRLSDAEIQAWGIAATQARGPN